MTQVPSSVELAAQKRLQEMRSEELVSLLREALESLESVVGRLESKFNDDGGTRD